VLPPGAEPGVLRKPLDKFAEDPVPFNVDELVTLCPSCHGQPTGIA
jgi:hypothetical protein